MRIIFVFPYFLPNVGGTELPMFFYARELVKRGHHVTVYAANALRGKPATLPAIEVIEGINVERFNYFSSLNVSINRNFFFAPSLVPKLLSAKADIVMVFSLLPSFFLIVPCFIAKFRRILLVLYPQFNPYRSLFRNFLIRLFDTFFIRKLGISLLRMADHVVVLTKAEADFCKNHSIKNVAVVYEGITRTKVSKIDILRFKEKYGIKNSTKILLAVGRIQDYKGFDFLIKSMPIVLRLFKNTKLLIIGRDWGYLSKCKEIAIQLKCDKNVEFLGSVDDLELNCAYESADIVVVPSAFEIQSRVVLEALFHKKPLVTTTSVGPHELILRSGFQVTYGDAGALARAIINLLKNTDIAKRMGTDGYDQVKDFTWENGAHKIEEIFGTLMRNQHET